MGQQYLLSWQNESGQQESTRIIINGDMHNADRFVAELEQAARVSV